METSQRISDFFVSPNGTLADILRCIDANRGGIALIAEPDGTVLATATDGDMRRATLNRIELDTPISLLIEKGHLATRFISVPQGTSHEEALRLMGELHIRQVPVVDPTGRAVDIVLLDELPSRVGGSDRLDAVIMAGGFGTRMRPLTSDTPKPMLPVGGKPLMERMINQLGKSGISSVRITTHYLKEKISSHFGNGSEYGMDLSYVDEEKPMGTAGALRLMERPSGPTLIVNGDVLTDLDFRALHSFHQQYRAIMTMAVRDYTLTVPYGVVESDGVLVKRVAEKPRHNCFINAGIYILSPAAFDYIPEGQHFDMTDLVDALLVAKQKVASFPLHEYWMDIGSQEDYARAEVDIENGRVRT